MIKIWIFEVLAKKVTSIYWLISDSITDVSVPSVPAHKVVGKETITENIGDVSLQITPWSFFQANSTVSKEIFSALKDNSSGSTVDLCCGVGAITLFVGDSASSLLGIEEVKESIELARKNAEHNGVKAL